MDDGGTRSPKLRPAVVPVGIVLLALATVSVCAKLPGRSGPVVATAIVALLVAAAGFGWAIRGRPTAGAQDLIALAAVGLAGVVLTGLVPAGGAYFVYLSLAGLGMRLPLRLALSTGVIIFVAANIVFWVAGKQPRTGLAGQDIGAALFFSVGVFTRSADVAQAQARAAQARAEDLLAQLRASQAALTEAAALAERARLAREIHDILAHALAGLVLALNTMELLGRQAGQGRQDAVAKMLEQVARAQRIARDGLADTRRAIAALRGDDLPGPALLDRLVRETAAATGVYAALTVTGEQRSLPPEIGLTVYRTAQETLTNTAKYAGPGGQAELRLRYGPDQVELTVEDTRADDAALPAAGLTFGGYGLAGMRERAELLGGTLTAGPTETGFRVVLRLPATSASDASEAEASRAGAS